MLQSTQRGTENMDLISKPRSKSVVWLYFGLKADDRGQPLNSGEAVCRLCRKIVLAKGGNTTNLRSHLRRRHRADFFENPSSTTPGALFETQGLDLNNEEFFEDLAFVQNTPNHNYVPDAVLPPGDPWLHGGPSRAVLSLPSCLCLCGDKESGSLSVEQAGGTKVIAKCQLQEGVMFGPFVGEMCRNVPTNLKYAWAIRDDAAFIYVDASDENKSNWMRYVAYTSREKEHNLVVFQFYRHIYYRVSQTIAEGTELRVWIGKDYASLLGLGMGTGDNVKCEIGNKETALRLLQDIQLVTLPEPSSTSFWSDHSQSQSPMPVISDVVTMSNPDAASDIGGISVSAFPTNSMISLPSPSSHSIEKYDFMPGTEKLLSNPNATQNSPWYFFGFEPDPTGRPLDRGTVVCKLCLEHVGCTGGAADLQYHLTNKHHIRARDITKDRSLPIIGQQRSYPLMVNSHFGLVSTLLPFLSAQVTDAITNFLIIDLQPPSLVEGTGFKQLIHTLQPSCKELPSIFQLENLLKDQHSKGKTHLSHLLRRKTGSAGNEDLTDYTAPIEFEPRRRGRPPSYMKEVPHFVILSVDIWFHNWQGNTGKYLTLWAHYIDSTFSIQNLALATKRLPEKEMKDCSLQAVEAQVKVMAQEWGISQPSLILLGGEGRSKMRLRPIKSEKAAEATGVSHPNSTTFLERDDFVSPDEPHGSEPGYSDEGLPSVPCFFSAVQGCIEEVMSHPIIYKTLSQFHSYLSTLFLPPGQRICHQLKGSYSHHAQSLWHTLTKEEQAELQSWSHSQPTWNKLYPLLSTLTKHKSLICEVIKEIQEEGLFKEDAASESSLLGCYRANSTSVVLRSDWKVLEDLCLVIRPLDVACRTIAKEAFPRLSLVKPILTGLLSRHLVTRAGDSPSVKEVKRMMRRNLASCYNSPVVNQTLCVACSLDPQFHGLGFMDEKEQTATFDWLKKEAVRIVKEDRWRSQGKKQSQIKRSPSPGSPESESDFLRRSKRLKESRPINFKELENEDEDSDAEEVDGNDSTDPEVQAGLSGMEFLLGDLFSATPRSRQSSVKESVDIEMSVFRADRGASLGVEPLQWWRTKAVQFPLLATVARAYLAAPAVAGNAAQDFVRDRMGVTYRKRANIPPESLDAVLFLHYNNIVTNESVLTAVRNDKTL